MKLIENIVLESKHGRPFLMNVHYKKNDRPKPVIIFTHGFKGFKDWGHWQLFCSELAKNNFVVISFNFSFNGTTIDDPLNFSDLEAFGQNNFSKELDDLGTVIDWIGDNEFITSDDADLSNINLIGHSRGGGIVILKAAEDERINKVCTLASVSGFEKNLTEEMIDQWKKDGKMLIYNGRTKQQMPLYFQLHENYFEFYDRLNVEQNAKKLDNKVLVIHGMEDEAVPISSAHELNNWINDSELLIVENANHVFGGKHPYDNPELPDHTKTILEVCTRFFNK